jgi:hypothetical protein
MIEKYGGILNDGSIEEEARQAAHNEVQAQHLLAELRQIDKKTTIDRELLKSEAKRLIGTMKEKEIRPDRFYRQGIKAAEMAASAQSKSEKSQFKTQQLVNHYLYKESLKVMERINSQKKYIKAAQTKTYTPKEVAPEYAQNRMLYARLYDGSKKERTAVAKEFLNWALTQIQDPNQFIKPEVIDINLAKALSQMQDGKNPDYLIPKLSEMTVSELESVYQQLRHLRYVGGKLSDSAKAQLEAERKVLSEEVKANKKDFKKKAHEDSALDPAINIAQNFIYSHRRLGGIFDRLDGFKRGAFTKVYEKFNDANDIHLKLQRKMSHAIDQILDPIGQTLSTRRKTSIDLEGGGKWELTPKARLALILNWGNEGNRLALLDGLNKNHPETYTETDIENMMATASKEELEAANKLWAVGESLWSRLSKVEVRAKGVAPTKVDASPFEVNSVKMTGGHYKLTYKPHPSDAHRAEFDVENALEMSISMSTAGSLHERVGSGGREVDLQIDHLFNAIDENIHYIAYKELSSEMNSLFKGGDTKVEIINRYGQGFYDNLIQTMDVIFKPKESDKDFWVAARKIRTNLTYAYLAYSLRNIAQQPIAVTNAFSQLGAGKVLRSAVSFYSSSRKGENFVVRKSEFMKNRTALVNREAREQLAKIEAVHPAWKKIKKFAFAPQTFMDGLVAYPTWMAAYEEFHVKHPKGSEKEAIHYADDMVAKTIGSGLSKDLGRILSGNEVAKQVTFMGTFFNVTYNLHAENVQKLKSGDIGIFEYARRLGWMAVAPAILSMWILDEFPEDDDETLKKVTQEALWYNMTAVFGLREVASAQKGFTPTIPAAKAFVGVKDLGVELWELGPYGEGYDEDTPKKLIRGLQPLVPLPGSSQIIRTEEGLRDPKQEIYGALMQGKERD